MRVRGIFRLAIAALVTLLLVQSPAPAAEEQLGSTTQEHTGISNSEILIGSCLPLSGQLSERGQSVTAGANLYISYINDQGGINGRKIKLETFDDQYDPNKAIECFNNHLKNKVFCGFLFTGSAPIAKYVKMAEVNQLPMLGFCTGTPVVYEPRPTIFTIRPSYADEVRAIIDHLCRVRGLKKIAVVYQSDAFGAAVRENTVKELAHFGLAPVAESSYSRESADLEDAFESVKQSQPDAVVLGVVSDKLMWMIRRKKQAHWNTLFVCFSVGTDYLLANPAECNGVVVAQSWPLLDEKLPAIALYNKLRKKYTPQAKPNLSTFEGMLNAMVLVEALKRAGKDLSRSKFLVALESLHDFDLGLGPNYKVNFSQVSHSGLTAKAVYFAMIKEGNLARMTNADWKQLGQ